MHTFHFIEKELRYEVLDCFLQKTSYDYEVYI